MRSKQLELEVARVNRWTRGQHRLRGRGIKALVVALAFLPFATSCGVISGIRGICSNESSLVLLVDQSDSTDDPDIREGHRNFVATGVSTAVDECAGILVAGFGGSTGGLEAWIDDDAVPEGENSFEREENQPLKAAELFSKFESEFDGVLPQGSDPHGAIGWACRQSEEGDRIRVITDGIATSPFDFNTQAIDDATAVDLGLSLALLWDGACQGRLLYMVGLGDLKGVAPPSNFIRSIRLIWSTACAGGGFQVCDINESRPTTVEAANNLLSAADGDRNG